MSITPRDPCDTRYVDTQKIDFNAQPRLIYNVGTSTIYLKGQGSAPQMYAQKPEGEGAMVYSSPYNRAMFNYYGVKMNSGLPPGYTTGINSRQVRYR